MTDDRMALIEALQKADDGNFLRAQLLDLGSWQIRVGRAGSPAGEGAQDVSCERERAQNWC